MPVQLVPELSQSCHAYWYEVGLFVHVPLDVVSVCPTAAVPLICGSPVFDGGAGGGATTTAV